ncbi:MAG: hypothetical protein KME40_17895 [Komarekiella atlantica HA4396-MV6]|jgi:hypothetical protein|nr:hypothetical protein [Komarekiella atlantica HA4396-MV6]
MKPANYSLNTIQTRALELNAESTRLTTFLFGLTDEVTPQSILEQFAELDKRYQTLKNRIESIQQSIDDGQDPDRHLFMY